ncbi:MAG TPA: ATPase domain-containing protein [Nitrososphaerales archaeon]|nr:ATPase domain-containing protein [Nitrososphaerales archaeon]
MSSADNLNRVPTGVSGLDPLIQGGLLKGDFVLLTGGIGTGKTIFSSQFVYNGAKQSDMKAVFATFEEDVTSLKRNMLKFGMDFDALEKEKLVKLVDLEALEGRGMGTNIDMLLGALDELKAKRLVVDSLTAFLSGATQKFDYSFLMHLIYKTLKREGITTVMTVSRFQETGDFSSNIEEFVADGIFQLENYLTDNMELRSRFIVRKLRGTDHSRKYHRVVFTQKGLEILPYTG